MTHGTQLATGSKRAAIMGDDKKQFPLKGWLGVVIVVCVLMAGVSVQKKCPDGSRYETNALFNLLEKLSGSEC